MKGRHYHSYFKDDKTKIENGLVMFPRLPTQPGNGRAEFHTQVYWNPNPMFYTEGNMWTLAFNRPPFKSQLSPKVNHHYFLLYFVLSLLMKICYLPY